MRIINDKYIVYDDDKGILYESYDYTDCTVYFEEMQRVEKEIEELDKNYKDFINQTNIPDEKYMEYDEETKSYKEAISHGPTIKESSKEIVDLIINNPTLPVFCSLQKNDKIKYDKFYNGYAAYRVQQTCGAEVIKVIMYHGEILTYKEDLVEKVYAELDDKYEEMYKRIYDEANEEDYNEYGSYNNYYNDYCDFLDKLTQDIVKRHEKYWIDAIVIFIQY